MIDFQQKPDFGVRVEKRLREEQVIWLTCVSEKGIPQPSPVWFVWDGNTFLIYSQPDNKVRHIQHNPQVSLNFNTTADGDDVVVISGKAVIDRSAPPVNQMEAYLEKYSAGIVNIDMTPDSYSASFSVPIRIYPTHVRGF